MFTEVLGVRLLGHAPFESVEFALTLGTTAIAGVNSAGKTRLLTGIRDALNGELDDAELLVRLHDDGGPDDALADAINGAIRISSEHRAGYSKNKYVPLRDLVEKSYSNAEFALNGYGSRPAKRPLAAADIADQSVFALRGTRDGRMAVFVAVDWRSEANSIQELHRAVTSHVAAVWRDVDRAASGEVDEDEAGLDTSDLDMSFMFFREDPYMEWHDDIRDLHAAASLPVAVLEIEPDQRVSRSKWPLRLAIDVDSTEGRDIQTRKGLATIVDAHDFDATPGSDFRNSIAARMEAPATASLTEILPDAGVLQLDVGYPSDWLVGDQEVEWQLRSPNGDLVPVDALGQAQRRWAQFAIVSGTTSVAAEYAPQIAGNRARWTKRPGAPEIRPMATWLIVDEPEQAVHRLAETQIAASLTTISRERGVNVMYSTHSPAFFGAADRVVVVSRDGSGIAHARGIPDDAASLAAALGTNSLDLLGGWTQTFVMVEGEHDKAVIGALLGDHLYRCRATIATLGGVGGRGGTTSASVDASFIAEYTEAKIIVVIDGLGAAANEIWDRAVDRSGDRKAAEAELRKLGAIQGFEATFLQSVGHRLLERGQMSRAQVVALSVPDIIDVLPVDDFVPGAASWEALRRESGTRSGTDFKGWLRNTKRARINVGSLAASAANMDRIPDDFTRLIELLELNR